MRKYVFCAIVLATVFFSRPGWSCTTGLASADATLDGRALLWKNRDSGHVANEVACFHGKGMYFTGIINADDTSQVWAGINQYGFAVMNAESRDMAVPGEKTTYDDEGILMKEALARCRNIDDFERMLRESNMAGRAVTSNFGVLDASGAAAFFETGNHEYFRFDADAAEGDFLIRANFAVRARSDEGYGKIRFARAQQLFEEALSQNSLDARYVSRTVSTDVHLAAAKGSATVRTQDTVNRYRTVSAATFSGVRAGEDPELSTFWCTLGEPAVSVSVPLWTYARSVPDLLNGADGAVLNELFRRLKAEVYDSDDPQLLDKARALEIQEELQPLQNLIFRRTERQLRRWRQSPPPRQRVARYQEKTVERVYRRVSRILGASDLDTLAVE